MGGSSVAPPLYRACHKALVTLLSILTIVESLILIGRELSHIVMGVNTLPPPPPPPNKTKIRGYPCSFPIAWTSLPPENTEIEITLINLNIAGIDHWFYKKHPLCWAFLGKSSRDKVPKSACSLLCLWVCVGVGTHPPTHKRKNASSKLSQESQEKGVLFIKNNCYQFPRWGGGGWSGDGDRAYVPRFYTSGKGAGAVTNDTNFTIDGKFYATGPWSSD